MKEQMNSYLITLFIVVAAVGATWLILRVASGTTASTVGGSEAKYAPLQESILNQ